MKRYLFFIITLITSLLAFSCQDEDFGFTQEEIFKNAYERNFIKAFGPIDPNQSWDLSSYGYKYLHDEAKTRAAGDAEDGWYKVPQNLLDGFLKTTLAEGGTNSTAGEAFCFLSGQEDFELTPIYQQGASSSDWELHMVMFKPDGSSKDEVAWTKSQRLKIQSDVCETCDGRGYVKYDDTENYGTGTMPCKSCNNGYLQVYDGASVVECYHCHGSGNNPILEDCGTCHGTGKITCPDCHGEKRTITTKENSFLFIKWTTKTYHGCTRCGGSGKRDNVDQERDRGLLWNAYKKGTGLVKCDNPNCTDGKVPTTCGVCFGAKKLAKCPYCDTTQNAHICKTCNGSGSVGASWQTLGKTDDTGDAKAIEGQPITTKQVLGVSSIPSGSIIYFYLKNGTKRITSMEGGMRLFFPTEMGLGPETKIIGCEEDPNSTTEGQDFNDLVFLLKGTPTPLRKNLGDEFTTIVDKRYMAEDFGSKADWDFNDIVVDMARTIKQKLTKNSSGVIQYTQTSKHVTATINHLCGTVPIQVKIGNHLLPKITNPTDPYRTLDELGEVAERDRDEDTYDTKNAIGQTIDYSFDATTWGWDPDANTITIYVWKDKNGNGIEGNTNEQNVWQANFPSAGDVPYIIATDVSDDYTAEEKQIYTMPWFQRKYPNFQNSSESH